ncbi:cysteine protease [Arachnomyces sp. PD_36]|nr:cysteine protease [Arachnomyces sp. PD_36]
MVSGVRLKDLETQALNAEKNVATATTQGQALKAAIDAAEHYMKALKIADTPEEKKRLDAKCKELLTTAEQIKHNKSQHPARHNSTSSGGSSKPSEPLSTRELSTREQIILLEGAKLNGFVFPPWGASPTAQEFELLDGDEPFVDSPELPLSPLQREMFSGWRRPRDLASKTASTSIKGPIPAPTMVATNPVDLVQDVTTDCSVVASLCAAISRAERGFSKVASSMIYPFNEDESTPSLSASGKYVFRLHFNGCYRKVVIDDRLPASKTKRFLHVMDRNNPDLLWPALLEKAYLKVRGGYDFPGSNSGTDLWVLTGWIPEQIFLHHEDVTSDQLWKRIFKPFISGDVLLTAGTGEMTEQEETGLGLVSKHDFAILDMKEVYGRRQMLIKNPWASGEVRADIGQFRNVSHSDPTPSQSSNSEDSQLSPGTSWVDYDHFFQNFENLYLNWNPSLFLFRQDIHFTWNLSTGGLTPGCFVTNPQFAVTSRAGGTVWLLLSKHFQTGDYARSEENHQLIELSEDNEPGFISIYIFKKDGQRVHLSDGAMHRGPYVDSPNTLARIEMPPRTTYTVVIAEQSLRRSAHNFSLLGFSSAPLSISHATEKYPNISKIQGAWTVSTAGGNADSPKYGCNPQFSLRVLEKSGIVVLLETEDAGLATHVKVLWSNGKRVATVRPRDTLTDSGDYRPSCSMAEMGEMMRGKYTVVCSTFAPDQIGRFTLWVFSAAKCELKALPAESAGRLAVKSKLGVFVPGHDRILAPLTVPRLTRVKAIARLKSAFVEDKPLSSSHMLMTIEMGQGPYKDILASSGGGDFGDAAPGLRIEDVDLRPGYEQRGGVWLVVERIGTPGGQVEEAVEVEFLCEERIEIGDWQNGDA